MKAETSENLRTKSIQSSLSIVLTHSSLYGLYGACMCHAIPNYSFILIPVSITGKSSNKNILDMSLTHGKNGGGILFIYKKI